MARLALDGVFSQKIHRKLLSIGSFHPSVECSLSNPCDMAVQLAKGVSVSALFTLLLTFSLLILMLAPFVSFMIAYFYYNVLQK